MIRLDKYIMNALQISRSDAKKIIKSKAILLNDSICTNSDTKINENDSVKYNDQELIYKENIYLVMNKPPGYVCAKNDNLHKTVMDLIKDYDTSKLSIVGRLDIDTTGLLLITNDGELVHRLTSPKSNCIKKYFVKVLGTFTNNDTILFSKGLVIIDDNEEYKCKPSVLEILTPDTAFISISEGKFHQVKKMCAATGKEVIKLKRVSIGKLDLDSALNEGEYRELTIEEEEIIKNY